MKPNDEAIKAAILAIKENGPYYAGSKIRESMAKHLAEVALPAAYAAQFLTSEDYRILVNSLRDSETRYIAGVPAADALEAVLAERDELDKWLRESKQNFMRVDIERNNLRAERDALKAELEKAQEIAKIQAERIGGYIKTIEDREAERDALLARLAPVEDYNLEIMAAKEFIEATTDMPPRTTYTISKRSLSGARNAIAAVRPHIEAAERERSSEFLGLFLELLGALKKVVATHHQCINLTPETISKFEDLASQAEEIAKAIRRGK